MIDKNAVWLITGCSAGLGRDLARAVLQHGYRAVVTARDPGKVADIVAEFGDRAMAAALDVTQPKQIDEVVRLAHERFGSVDVLVNNAGYGYVASIEEAEEDEVRALFETNFFGVVTTMRAVIPGMRERRRGHIVNVSSIGGFAAFTATGFYHATKFALEGLSESVAKEVAPFGIGMTIVEPSAFRTQWQSSALRMSKTRMPEYEETVGKRRDAFMASNGNQPGDPVRAAEAMIAAVEAERPPLRLLLGKMALHVARERLDSLKANFDAWAETTEGAEFPEADNGG